MNFALRNRSPQRAALGFSLVEVMVACLIAGVVFMSLFAGLSSGFQITNITRENLRAIQVLNEKMELMRLYTWAQITNPGVIPTTFSDHYSIVGGQSRGASFSGTMSIGPAPFTNSFSPHMRLVTAQIVWTSGNITHTREMQTLVSSNGLQSYIY